MKRLVLLLLSLAPLAFAASTPATISAPPVAKEFAPIVDDPKLPRVLIIGDSVSVAYTLDVRKNLAGIANPAGKASPAANLGAPIEKK
jgi:acyl-CoA thioesterase-1